jgi:hypothetical protein
MTATFSTSGPNGSFGGDLVETGFDDSPDGDATGGGGKARTLTLNTGGVPANSVRLDLLTDGEWLMLSEVTFQGRAATNVVVKATAILDTPPNFNAGAGAGLLTDGIIGPDNWLNGTWRYLGWQDAGYVPSDAGTDSGVAQPQLTFDLGDTYYVDSVTVHYNVDYPPGSLRANLRAPDLMTAQFSASGASGPFGGNLIETGFDDSPDGDGSGGGGQARSVTTSLGSAVANAMRLDFRTDGEWLFLSEVTFLGTAVPTPNPVVSRVGSGAGGTSIRIRFDTVPGLWYRVVQADSVPSAVWTEVSPGWKQGLGLPMEVGVDATPPAHGQGFFQVEISPTQPEG